jgi:transcriptional regulator with XRE-family HTH domain
MTQKELAEALGIAQSQVSRYCARGMPLDVPGAKDWIGRHIRLTMKAPLYRRQTRPMQRPVATAPKVWTAAELFDLANEIITIMLRDDEMLAEGAPYLRGVLSALCDLDEIMLCRVMLPPPVWCAVTGEPLPEAAP